MSTIKKIEDKEKFKDKLKEPEDRFKKEKRGNRKKELKAAKKKFEKL
ncbi:hypothetical protein [Borreliella lusitaniae]